VPTFSVIIPVYNRASTLDRCLTSVAQQRYPATEIVAVDDGSSDGSVERLREWQTRFPDMKIDLQTHRGVAAARNNAVRQSSGEWLAFLDSDDEWHPDKLSEFAASIKQNSALDFIFSDRVAPDGTTRGKKTPDINKEQYESKFFLLADWRVQTSALAMKRELYNETGTFNETLYSCSDFEFWWRAIALSRGIRYIPRPLTSVHAGPGGMARALPEIERLRDNLRAMGSAISWMKGRPDVPKDLVVALDRWRTREWKQLIHVSRETSRYSTFCTEAARFLLSRGTGAFNHMPRPRPENRKGAVRRR